MAAKTEQKQGSDPFSAHAIESGNLSAWTPVSSPDKEKITDSVFEPLSAAARNDRLKQKNFLMKQQLNQLQKELQPDWAKANFANGNPFSILEEE